MRLRIFLLATCAAATLSAQAIATTGVERDIPALSSWRLSYDNDFFTSTDK